MFYGFDPTIIIFIPAIIFTVYAQRKVQSTYATYSRVPTKRKITGGQVARMILDRNGLYHVRIERVSGNLTDHFDPRANVLRLSDSVYGADTAAAVGVAAHEAGHAIQHAERYLPIRIRQAIIPLTNIGSRFGIWIFIIGIILTAWSQQMIFLCFLLRCCRHYWQI